MRTMTRRDLWAALPALGAFSGLLAFAEAADPESQVLREAAALPLEQLAPHSGAHGMVSRPVLRGKLPTGEIVELHETTLMPGQMPHPPHRHTHTEFMLIREGTVEFLYGDQAKRLGPGGVAYAASGQMHGLRNVGSTPANYFVLAIGSERS